jgi:hypothetical protein
MADNADTTDVATLEAEVEEARSRLAATIDKLADPATHEAMKDEIMARVQGYKDQILGSARGTGQGFADDLKARAMNNPAAVAMIGAGLAYRLYRHPPVATLLVGGGIAMLMRARGRTLSDPTAYRAPYDRDQPRGYVPGGVAGYGYPVEEDAPGSTTTDRIVQTASQAGEKARDAAHEAGERISEAAEHARAAAQDTYERTRSTVQDTYERTRAAAQDTYERARSTVRDTSESAAGTYGRAADRVGGAAHEAYDRAGSAYDRVRNDPWMLGALGVAAGAALAVALRRTETGDRFVGATGDAIGRGARGVGSTARHVASRAAESASGLAATAASAAGSVASSVTSAAAGVADAVTGLVSDADEPEPARGGRQGRGGRGSRGRPSSGRARDRAGRDDGDFMTSAAEAASSAYRSAAEQADYARRRAAGLAGEVADQVFDLGRNYPLLLGAIGIAAGAAVGLAMRPTESEDDLIGPYADTLKARAREAFAEQYHEVVGAAQDLAESFADGGSPSGRPAGAPAADWETVIGGGAPPVQGSGAGSGAGAGSGVGPKT